MAARQSGDGTFQGMQNLSLGNLAIQQRGRRGSGTSDGISDIIATDYKPLEPAAPKAGL